MLYDPLYIFLKNLEIEYLPLALIYGLSFILAMTVMLFISGGTIRVREYLKDPLGAFIWPFFVLTPIVMGYLSISHLAEEINKNFSLLHLDYRQYSLRLDKWQSLFWIIVALAFIEGVENVIRYHRVRPNLWLSKPKLLQPISTVLFNIPLGIMVLVLILRIIDQWVSFHRFMTSGWLPTFSYHQDEMYGLRWLYTILLTQMIVAVLASFSSLLILIREGKQKYSWMYKAVFFLCISCSAFALYILTVDMNSLLQTINTYFLGPYYVELNQLSFVNPVVSPDKSLQKMLVIQEISIISDLPRSMPIPNWLNGVIGVRLLIFIPEIYAFIAKPLGWKKLQFDFKKVFDFIK